jgi:hypothetical protein
MTPITERPASPETTGLYACPCGNREQFVGEDRHGYPGPHVAPDQCPDEARDQDCTCEVELTQPFRILPDRDEDGLPDIDYGLFYGGGCGAEIGQYTSIRCAVCRAVIWEEAP